MSIRFPRACAPFIALAVSSIYSTQAYACCFGCDVDFYDDYEGQPRRQIRYPLAPVEVKNNLETQSKKIRSDAPEDKYKKMGFKTHDDKSRTTSYCKPLRPLHSGALFGPDDRVRVRRTTQPQYSVHGYMKMTFPNGMTSVGSGTIVRHRHVLTAGHCIYDRDAGGWATKVKFTPARDDTYLPVQAAYATHLLSVSGWKDREDPEFDMGMLVLNRDVGEETGWLGLSEDTDRTLHSLTVNVTGYPGEKPSPQMWTMSGKIKSVFPEQFTYTLDTTGGQSGSGVWTEYSNFPGYYCVGIHTSGQRNVQNTATRLTKKKFDTALEWMNTIWQ